MNPKQLTIEQVQEILRTEQYICDRSLATVVYLSLIMGKPLLLEGEAGVGKTEIAKVLSKVLSARLIRLQCYEGLDVGHAEEIIGAINGVRSTFPARRFGRSAGAEMLI